MLATYLRQAATALMESAIRIAPQDSREWGQAMRSELDYVEEPWGALRWAFGGASVLARRALASFFFPSRRGQGIPGGTSLFARDVPIREAALAASAACALAALLFFTAPPFRQALRISFLPWMRIAQHYPKDRQPRLEALAHRAEQQRDAEGLAFCAIRLSSSHKSARLAEEAVRLNPNLLWVYAVVAVRHPDLPEISQWLPRLRRWDPQNALFPLITAERNDIHHALREDGQTRGFENDLVWQRAMTAAFQSPKFDDYSDRAQELDRRVVLRYRFYDPEEVLFAAAQGVLSYTDCQRFADLLIRSGEDLEARGERKRALERYLTVAHFGQLIDSEGHTDLDHAVGWRLQATAYQQLQALSLKEGRQAEASLFGYLAAKFNLMNSARERRGKWVFGLEICKRNAAFVQISGILILIFAGLLTAGALILIVGRRGGKSGARRFGPTATGVTVISSIGLLLSSATLYLTYRPYWYIFQGAILNGDQSQVRDLHDFLIVIQSPFLFLGRVYLPELSVYFWSGLIFLCTAALVLILLRHFGSRAQPDGFQHHPHVP
jgi:hypothetical protein